MFYTVFVPITRISALYPVAYTGRYPWYMPQDTTQISVL